MESEGFRRLRNLSRVLRWISLSALLGLVALAAALVPSSSFIEGAVAARFGPNISATGVTPVKHLALVATIILNLLPAIWCLAALTRLFAYFAKGEVLSPRPARCLLTAGWALALVAFVSTLTPTIAGLILTWDNPPGGQQLILQLSSNSLALLLFGGLMTTIGWAMSEAAIQAAENRSFV